MLKRFLLQAATFLFILIISFSSVQHPITSGYINELRNQAAVTVMKEEDPLYMEILAKQKDYHVAPQDAVIDSVWKAIPGYNGISVDVQASYDRMKSSGMFSEAELVYQQIPPKVTLKDLPPAPIYRGHPDKQMVTFMINVAWGNEYLTEILKILNHYKITSTFFLDGSWVKKNPDLAKMVLEEGHEIGNHAYSHPNMQNLSRNGIYDEMVRTNEVLQTTLSVTPDWFAPPSGSYRQEVVDVARELGMYTVLWTVDTVDWKNPNPAEMAQRVVEKTEAGTLILMHPTEATVKGLEAMITGITAKGLEIGPLGKVLNETRINDKR
ncbi:probable sporulation protein, polysaccharide deacetylase family [Evansella caseinilytica]|uniref:Probable sporulation protein, polysaccharide deacetylase family n=1 Tax=Evansella caseinilytica TaxID=1503961 RepID=A0A1H3M1Y4_9BACI|nr:polysaccharide deacetylase family protein [Evansella caseinilytica]SDY70258.1 probable sporulation protein, polysaccharide deacetylase family [Evansella caseinilytica]